MRLINLVVKCLQDIMVWIILNAITPAAVLWLSKELISWPEKMWTEARNDGNSHTYYTEIMGLIYQMRKTNLFMNHLQQHWQKNCGIHENLVN